MCPMTLDAIYRLFCKFPGFIKIPTASMINLFLKVRLQFIKTPTFIIFFVTNKCNANCKHCFYQPNLNKSYNEISLEEIEKIAHSLKNNNTILLTGGEPFLRDDLLDICRVFYNYGKTKKIRIATNGYFTDRIISISEKLLQDNIALDIQVSLDAIGGMHDQLRGLDGLFAKATETLTKLIALKKRVKRFRISTIATITKTNYDKLENLSNYIKEKFDLELDLALVREPGVGVYNLDSDYRSASLVLKDNLKLPDYDTLKNILSKRYSSKKCNLSNDFAALVKEIELSIIFEAKRPPFNCCAGITDAVIYPNGEVSSCETLKSFARLQDYDYNLYKLWNSTEMKQARKKKKSCYCMHPCHLISAMKHDANFLLRL